MSIKVMSEVWEHAPFIGTDLLILLALADMANEDRECWPSLKHLAHKGRIKIRQVGYVTENLELQGIITINPRKLVGGGNTSNMYYIKPYEQWDLLVQYQLDNPHEPQCIPLLHHSASPYGAAKGKDVIEPSLKPQKKRVATSTTPAPLHPLIASWATIRKIDAVNIGAPIFTNKDLATAKRMAKWDTPPTEDEIKNAITNSKAPAYAFQWLEGDIPKLRLQNSPKPSTTPSNAPTDAQLEHDYMEMFGDKRKS